ncbi:HD domain-containing protein [Alloscardovia omnicolens]|uniref:HDIG domain protein n=1 Tax=Alloscardovia omnicolens F0580 TaxID=1321816 RepID=U1RCW8_9BIFI|nr:HD domain-containing protein [Alloscardovia omnicolens]ERH31866.1 HDIG domain protein [Alloscardovia omnicolens F0580]MDK6249861.1 HD domain-containing protein [Alloscardovia omnicolens]MDK8073877.1 HD domain-containing protein [Alloscardovia omnicolens]
MAVMKHSDLWNTSETTRALRELHKEQARAFTLNEQSAQKSFALIATHCEIVARLAVILAEQSGQTVTNTLIEGALAHDIGTYSVLAHNAFAHNQVLFQRDIYIQHGTRGYELLLANGFGEEIAAFARNHTGVGITKADCVQQKLPIEPADYMPTNAAQEIVALADKFHTKLLPPRFVSEQTARARVEKFGSENIARWDKLVACYGVPPRDVLDELAHEYRMEIL